MVGETPEPTPPPATDPRRIVADGYDVVAERYRAWSDDRPSSTRLTWLARAIERIPAGSDVLDLGCGAGVPMTRALAAGRRVTGVDISARQIELARAAVPEAHFVHADMTALDLQPASLDAVVAFYSLTHVPRIDLPSLLEAIHRWLRPGGVLVATMGAEDSPDDVEDDWLGAPMFFSHYGAKRNRALVREAGFDIEMAVVEEEPGDRHGALFLWVIGHKTAEGAGGG
ncbi:MAG: class I SAM-dependent methyltransferase [Chloroflexota bacterium]